MVCVVPSWRSVLLIKYPENCKDALTSLLRDRPNMLYRALGNILKYLVEIDWFSFDMQIPFCVNHIPAGV